MNPGTDARLYGSELMGAPNDDISCAERMPAFAAAAQDFGRHETEEKLNAIRLDGLVGVNPCGTRRAKHESRRNDWRKDALLIHRADWQFPAIASRQHCVSKCNVHISRSRRGRMKTPTKVLPAGDHK